MKTYIIKPLAILVLALIGCQQTNTAENVVVDTNNGYSIVWKYKIKPEHKDKFEFEYGSNGAWYKLFKTSDQYLGSYLHKSDDEAFVYLLIDKWTSKEAYEDFLQNNEMYNQLSSAFESLYVTEEKIGTFNLLP